MIHHFIWPEVLVGGDYRFLIALCLLFPHVIQLVLFSSPATTDRYLSPSCLRSRTDSAGVCNLFVSNHHEDRLSKFNHVVPKWRKLRKVRQRQTNSERMDRKLSHGVVAIQRIDGT